MLSHVADMLGLIKSICTLLCGAASERVLWGRIGGAEMVSERGEGRGAVKKYYGMHFDLHDNLTRL